MPIRVPTYIKFFFFFFFFFFEREKSGWIRFFSHIHFQPTLHSGTKDALSQISWEYNARFPIILHECIFCHVSHLVHFVRNPARKPLTAKSGRCMCAQTMNFTTLHFLVLLDFFRDLVPWELSADWSNWIFYYLLNQSLKV